MIFNTPTIDDLVWMVDNIPGYVDKVSVDQLKAYDHYKESRKHAKWIQRQKLKEISNFQEPFPGFFAGVDLYPEGAPASYYNSTNQ